jgi:NADH-quinone oxidoreductase subunit C
MNFTVPDEALSELGEAIRAAAGAGVAETQVAFGELTVLAEASQIVQLMSALRDHPSLGFQQLIDVCGVDYPERAKRFDVVYHLLSLTLNRRVRVKVQADETSAVPSVTGIYPNADWYERETFDMYGVYFDGHPDLRRILTDYGFQGYPLRKDFPMTGYVEVRYDDEQKRVVYEPVKITEFRAFDFLSPWEGAEYVLPGDEKAGAK